MEDAEEFCIEDEPDEEEKKARPLIKNAMDLQRLKLEKLMKNPDKPIIIPEPSKEKDFMQTVPTFVRNVMGSSAGAGSGEFHVYRHLRRKEYARQKYIQAKSTREQLDDDYRQKLEQNRLDAEAKTAKRRAKRIKKKLKRKQKGNKRKKDENPEEEQNEEEETTSESSSESEEDDGQRDDTGNDADTETDTNQKQPHIGPIQNKETEEKDVEATCRNNDNTSSISEESKDKITEDADDEEVLSSQAIVVDVVQPTAEKEEDPDKMQLL